LRDKREEVMRLQPSLSALQISELMGKIWKELLPEQKHPYE
jgi:hypothetical protein